MARANFIETVAIPNVLGYLVPVVGAQAVPYNVNADGSEGSQANAYADRASATPASLTSDTTGRISLWLDDGDYNIHISGSGFTSYVVGFTAAVLNSATIQAAAQGTLFFPGDYKFSHQSTDHGALGNGTYEWLRVVSGNDGRGRLVPQGGYSNLWLALGQPELDGSGNFRLPNVSGRTFIATGSATDLNVYTLNQMLGEELHTLALVETPRHSHNVTVEDSDAVTGGWQAPVTGNLPIDGQFAGPVPHNNVWVPKAALGTWLGASLTHGHRATQDHQGNDQPHNNIQPSYGMNLFIKS